MARTVNHPPSAACLSASMRDLGYSLETAVADLIDNSLSARSTRIEIICDASSARPLMAIVDDGEGMSGEMLLLAMRHGTVDPKKLRAPDDLGRFGLGLKTASFSQCRSLTVVSAKEGQRSGAEWDLDRIDADDDWTLSILEEADIDALPFVDGLGFHGTAVIWHKLDRLFENESGERRDEIVSQKLDLLGRHLSLVFHRFLAGEIKGYRKVSISINGHAIEPFDPFCTSNAATQILPQELVRIGNAEVRLQPFVLPHHSRLSAREFDYYLDRSDFISNQGAYIYRNGRLMAWGDWFRLVPKGEATKLARVRIDFPNTLDEAWTIDIKKSRARPPHAVRERLRQIITTITSRSVTVYRGRGQRLFHEAPAPLWERYADQGRIRFSVSPAHPLVTSLAAKLPLDDVASLYLLLESVAASLPVEMIYSDFSTHPRDVSQAAVQDDQILDRLSNLKHFLYGEEKGDPAAFLQIVQSTNLFAGQTEMVRQFISKTFK